MATQGDHSLSRHPAASSFYTAGQSELSRTHLQVWQSGWFPTEPYSKPNIEHIIANIYPETSKIQHEKCGLIARAQRSEQHKTQLEYQMQDMFEYIAAVRQENWKLEKRNTQLEHELAKLNPTAQSHWTSFSCAQHFPGVTVSSIFIAPIYCSPEAYKAEGI